MKPVLYILLILATWVVAVMHGAVLPRPTVVSGDGLSNASSWTPKSANSLNQLVLFGNAYERGAFAGEKTKHLIAQEEQALVGEFNKFFPNPVWRWALALGAMRWFSGIEELISPEALQEMYGVAQSADPRFDFLIDPYTRQLVYHGLHEVGQMFVDFQQDDWGCTAFGLPFESGWMVGRNFDFDAVAILDTEKIVKWVFPDEGNAYVSITWAGMVGVVTGVNEHGVYISINAAGTTDFARYGEPSTLVAMRVLQQAKSASEAVAIIRDAKVFISDIYMVADRGDYAFQVEKSPKRVRVIEHNKAFAVANHFVDPVFSDDGINRFRREELTSQSRLARAEQLVVGTSLAGATPRAAARLAQSLLRDKRGIDGKLLAIGQRQALDALVATHAVIYDATHKRLYVSRGPALTGRFHGYDLAQSWRQRTPIAITSLPADTVVKPSDFSRLKSDLRRINEASRLIGAQECGAARELLANIDARLYEHSDYLQAMGDVYACTGENEHAASSWKKALRNHPAYARSARALRAKLESL